MSQITVRQKNFDFPEQISRYWYGNSVFKSHFFNSITLLFPDGEQFMLRTIKRQIKQIDNPNLKEEALAFVGQEAQHAVQHEKFWQNLRQQGYTFDRYLRWLHFILFNVCETRLNIKFKLAMIAGVEHFTNVIAELTLKEELFAEAEPIMKELFEWHSAEEIEHKTVAYDVLQNVTKNYLIRLIGIIMAYTFVLSFVNLGLIMMLYQDKKLLDIKVWQEMLQFFFSKEKFLLKVFWQSLDYLNINFHPLDRDNLFLIKRVVG
ncbi:metal-dependent hydrolase [Nostoc sp. TCL26-01]|uniref:metal-dependent hydrolase n=1 Tax=Nostoc sp. TCL26-01 TaxID=2576904 RepID=UPI0015BE7E4D|nr:metal-dependent hydrolase [Nostoc sp. TCL26-01]QLE58180.1 metal-dependent hydrolase [Nostoc sp. TCL26-01]